VEDNVDMEVISPIIAPPLPFARHSEVYGKEYAWQVGRRCVQH